MKKVLTCLAFLGIISIAPAFAQSNIQKLSNGKYEYCSIRPPSQNLLNNEIKLRQYYYQANAACFLFKKLGNKIIGYLNTTGESNGEDRICVEGLVKNNTISGRAVQDFPYAPEVIRQNPNESMASVQSYWREKKILRLSNGRFYNGNNYPYAIYSNALLNLNGFYNQNFKVSSNDIKQCL